MNLIAGATGLLGMEICGRLRREGEPVRALIRPQSAKADTLRAMGAELAEGDLKDDASLAAACQGVQTVVSTANAIGSRRSGDSLKTVDHDGQLSLVAAAARAGVAQFIYVSAGRGIPANNPFIRYKREVERAVRTSGMRWTIVQPSAFMEVHAGATLGWDYRTGRARILGTGRNVVSYVSVQDVAALIASAAGNSAAFDRELGITGPEPLTPLDAVRIAEEVAGRRFRVQRIPVPALRIMSAVLRPLAPIPSSLMAMMASAADQLVLPPALDPGASRTTFREYVRGQIRP
jgi:uncharacterized protein YbjT (DUF2867 family)